MRSPRPIPTDPPRGRARAQAAPLALASVLLLGACADGFDFDFRPAAVNEATLERRPTERRPPADARGVISYPGYQVAVAQRGDTPGAIAARVGLDPGELATFNGLPAGVAFRGGEVLALPRRVSEPGTGPIQPGAVSITTLAGAAIDRAAPSAAAAAAAAAPAPISGREPLRHEVARGETAYTIARAYDISVRALAEWNGLGPDLAVREGQFLMIPVVQGAPTAVAASPAGPAARPFDTAPPGAGSRAPEPPSAAAPLPEPGPEEVAVAAAPAAPALSEAPTEASSTARLRAPVSGAVIRPFQPGTNDGVDFAAPAGSPVGAAAAGTVAAITADTDGVPIMVVRHAGNLLTVYANIDNLSVARGDSVAAGQTIAQVREGGSLHFEVREGFDAVDPVAFLD